jgi:2,4-dienoyl-CoA reductase (NADPH2)
MLKDYQSSLQEDRMYPNLFSSLRVGGIVLKNRLIMAPTYLGYAGPGGTVSRLLLEHYRTMARSGVAMVVVENASIDHPVASGSDRTLRVDTEDCLAGLKDLAEAIKREGALACLQLNHAGRFAGVPEPLAPSAVETFGRMPKPLTQEAIAEVLTQFAAAARRVEAAGFDMLELHGGTGYLLAQFLSPRTNRRQDEYGGPLENRQKFALEVVKAVQAAVGAFPVGYRFLADEWLPDGLELAESRLFARTLAAVGVAYISVMGGTYESFFLPHILEKSKHDGYMTDLAAAIRKEVSVPVIAAGRIATGELAERIIREGAADLVGLARVLWADPDWVHKVSEGRESEIVHCDPACGDACIQMVMKKKPAFCTRWSPQKVKAYKALRA